MKQRVLANCYQCTGMYTDGRDDCEVEDCAFHVYMPYRKGGVVKVRAVSEETKAKLREARLRKSPKSNLSSWRKLWSLFQSIEARAMGKDAKGVEGDYVDL